MSIPSFQDWKKDNNGKGINDYYKEFPEARNSANGPIFFSTPSPNSESKSWIFWISTLLMVVLAIFAFNAIQNNKKDRVESLEKSREYHSPERYLVLYNHGQKMRIIGKSSITGTIENKSSHTTYVNIILAVNFYDRNDNFFMQEQVNLGKRMSPLEYNDFELKVQVPWKSKSYSVELASADVLRQ
ncbi:MAG: hypothetical protein KDC85_18170 [Saprospiraceae bacterium]|nr:hypothetical protein [Saprospiraceae bacterium]MCB9325861.1 hypothetical protein [Lewinellaceae bacterium]